MARRRVADRARRTQRADVRAAGGHAAQHPDAGGAGARGGARAPRAADRARPRRPHCRRHRRVDHARRRTRRAARAGAAPGPRRRTTCATARRCCANTATCRAPSSSSCSRPRWRTTRRAVTGGCRRSAPASAATARCCGCSDACRGACRPNCWTAWRATIRRPSARVATCSACTAFMRTRALLVRTLRQLTPAPAATRCACSSSVPATARCCSASHATWRPRGRAVELTLLDRAGAGRRRDRRRSTRVRLDARAERHGRARLGTRDRPHSLGSAAPRWDVVIANLFLHHFDGLELARAARGDRRDARDAFVACEPRRGWRALGGQPPDRRARRQRRDAHGRRAQRARRLSRARTHRAVAAVDGRLAPAGSTPSGAFSHCFRADAQPDRQ